MKSNYGNIFGGYTSKSWTSQSLIRNVEDDKAFLFLIQSHNKKINDKCPMIFDIREEWQEWAVMHHRKFGPVFGDCPYNGGWDIGIPSFGKDLRVHIYVLVLMQDMQPINTLI